MALKQKTCKSCRQKFVPTRPMQVACSPACAIAIAERKRTKQAQQEAAQKRKEARQAAKAADETRPEAPAGRGRLRGNSPGATRRKGIFRRGFQNPGQHG